MQKSIYWSVITIGLTRLIGSQLPGFIARGILERWREEGAAGTVGRDLRAAGKVVRDLSAAGTVGRDLRAAGTVGRDLRAAGKVGRDLTVEQLG